MSPDWSLVTPEALASLNIEELLASSTEREALAYSAVLAPMCADEARWQPAELTCLRFLQGVLQMVLRHASPQEPFGPMFVIDGKGGWLQVDIPKNVLSRIQSWADKLADAELRARLLDVAWAQGRIFGAVQGAVQAYSAAAKLPRPADGWYHTEARFERGLRLAASLGKGGLTHKEAVLADIQAAVYSEPHDDTPLRRRLIGLLLEFAYGDMVALGNLASSLGADAEKKADHFHASESYSLAADCFSKAGDADARARELRAAAEALASAAEAAFKNPGQGAIAASSLMVDAVAAMRQAGGGTQRAAEMHSRMLEWQALSLAELKEVSTTTDASELTRRAIAAVRGKPSFREAIVAFCRLGGPPRVEDLKRHVHEDAKEAVFASLLPMSVVNGRGRVVALLPPLTAGVQDVADDGLRGRMYRRASLGRDLRVNARLIPALQEICAEHHPSRHDITELIRYSSCIPEGHRESFVRALLAGFNGDMHLVAHFVPPQFEAMVRHVLERVGADTSVLAANGQQPERLFKPLLELEEAKQVFGEDAVFEMTDLFVDQLGSNLRNQALHGLMTDEHMSTTPVFYAWWLLLKYCVMSALSVEKRLSSTQQAADTALSAPAPGRAPDDTSAETKDAHD